MQEIEGNVVHESNESQQPTWEHRLSIEVFDHPTNVTSAVHQDNVSANVHAFINHNEE